MENTQALITDIRHELGYEASIEKNHSIDDSLLIISGSTGSASVWIFDDPEILRLRIDGNTPDFEIRVNDTAELKRFLLNVFEGNVARLTLPLYDSISVGHGPKKWNGVNIDFAWPLGRKKFSPYQRSQ